MKIFVVAGNFLMDNSFYPARHQAMSVRIWMNGFLGGICALGESLKGEKLQASFKPWSFISFEKRKKLVF